MAELKRTMGFVAVLALSIGSIIGTSMFVGPAFASEVSGTLSLVAWIGLLIISLYGAACFGELVAMFPSAGGVYEYAKQTYGRFFSFIVGWVGWLGENITTPLLIILSLNYLTPAQFPLIYKIIISLVFVVLLNVIAYIGIEASAAVSIAFSAFTVILITAVVLPGFFLMEPGNFTPLVTHKWSTLMIALFFIVETFFGWEGVTSLSEETKNPEKNIPLALILGTAIIGVMGIALVIVLLGIFGWQQLATMSAPLNNLAELVFGSKGIYITGLGIYIIVIGSAATGIIAAPRLLYAMARDRLFLPQFTAIHPKFNTPYKAVIFQTVVSAAVVFIALGEYERVLSLLIPMTFMMYVFTFAALTILRYKMPDFKRKFKVPFGKVGPILCALFYLAIMITWLIYEPTAVNSFIMSLGIVGLGVPFYFLLEMYYNPKAIRKMSNLLAYVTLWAERILLPVKVRKEIITLLGDIKGKNVLEFGCSVGTMTMHLAEEVTKKGKVYALDLAEKETHLARKRITDKGHKHVIVLHDEQLHSRLHPDVPDIHTVVSVGMLGYLQNIKKVLADINKKLKLGSKICFVDYDKFFDIIPNVDWLSDDIKIKKIFREAGFNVEVMRKQGFAWKYVYIYGIKVKNAK